MMSERIYSNIVDDSTVRKMQQKTLEIISNSVEKTFGPMGSHTAIVNRINERDISVKYTKDGHTVIKLMFFNNMIERSVQELMTELTRHVVKEVGDGTTSAAIISNCIFKQIVDHKDKLPTNIIKEFNMLIDKVNDRISSKSRECTLEDIYNISLISTNNDEDISATIREIYKKFGMDVMIDISNSTQTEHIIKEYDGMTLETGYADMCFINNQSKNTAAVRNPKVYCFRDNIDTPEMVNMFKAIIEHNIFRALLPNSVYELEPTVIFCRKLAPDISSYLETIVKLMNKQPGSIPLLIVSDIHQFEVFDDISKMLGAPMIKKYIDPNLQQIDVENGLAPTEKTIFDFCGTADMIEADQFRTKIINPKNMHNEDGSLSSDYTMIVNYLENEIKKAKNESESINVIGNLKRRLNCFKGNMVDFMVGGISESDKEKNRAAVEDAILNCRSAAIEGVGFGANYMAYSTLVEMSKEDEYKDNIILDIIKSAYEELITKLYYPVFGNDEETSECIAKSLEAGCPMNIRTKKFDSTVLSSIKSDMVVLETIGKILTLMYTCNQYLLPTPMDNTYAMD